MTKERIDVCEEILTAFREARFEAEEMLVRDGVAAARAAIEATRFVSFPKARVLSDEVIGRAEAELRMALPQDLRALVAVLDLSTTKVWDADLRPLSANLVGGIADVFLASVAELTGSVRRLEPKFDGLAFGTTQDGDYWILRGDGHTATRVWTLDHAGGMLTPCACDIASLLIGSARAAAAYYRRFGRDENEDDWAAYVLDEALIDGIEAGWLELSIRSRPRPG